MRAYSLVFPDGLTEDDEWLIQSKGWLDGVTVEAGEDRYLIEFYEPVRLSQTIADEIDERGLSVLDNTVVIPTVTLSAIETAIRELARGDFASLRPS